MGALDSMAMNAKESSFVKGKKYQLVSFDDRGSLVTRSYTFSDGENTVVHHGYMSIVYNNVVYEVEPGVTKLRKGICFTYEKTIGGGIIMRSDGPIHQGFVKYQSETTTEEDLSKILHVISNYGYKESTTDLYILKNEFSDKFSYKPQFADRMNIVVDRIRRAAGGHGNGEGDFDEIVSYLLLNAAFSEKQATFIMMRRKAISFEVRQNGDSLEAYLNDTPLANRIQLLEEGDVYKDN